MKLTETHLFSGWKFIKPNINQLKSSFVMIALPQHLPDMRKQTPRSAWQMEPTIKSRIPLLAWLNAVPFDGENPKAVTEAVSSWNKWLMETDIPKLCFYVTPGFAIKEKDVKIIKESMKNLKMINLGEGLHFIQEYYPHEIGEGIAEWYERIK